MVDLEVFSLRLPGAQEHSIPPRDGNVKGDGFMVFHVTPPKTNMGNVDPGLINPMVV